eukprot:4921202-Prymnesium_polylepis.1
MLGTAEFPVLIHCRSGRDRTGVVVAAVLSLLGVPEHLIIAEYARSDGADPALLEQTLAPWRAAGGIEQWARGANLAPVREHLVGDPQRLAHHVDERYKQEKQYPIQRVQDCWAIAKSLG